MKTNKLLKATSSLFNSENVERISFRYDINALRSLAVVAVIGYHANFKFFSGGWLGVDIFFVISGYLISNIVISELTNRNFKFNNFYNRRLRRIVPAVLSTILFCIPFSYWLMTPKALNQFTDSVFPSIFFFANYHFQNLDFYNASATKFMPLLHIWSLGVEEQFYIIFPILTFILFKLSQKKLLFSISFLFLVSLFLNSTTNNLIKFYQVQFRAWELLFGVLVMLINQKIHIKFSNLIGLPMILISIYYFDDTMLSLNSIEPKLIATIGTAFVLLSKENSYLTPIFKNNFIILIGSISFSLYLLHQPIFAFYRLFILRNNIENNFIYTLIVIVIIFLVAKINYDFVEKYFQFTSTKNLTLFIFSAIAISGIFVFLSNNSYGFKNRYDHVPEKVIFYSLNTNLYPVNNDFDEFYNHCNNTNKTPLYLIGDSHLNTFTYTLLTEYKELSCKYELNVIFNPTGRCLLSQQTDIVGGIYECSDEYFNKFLESTYKKESVIILIGRFDTWLLDQKGGVEVKCENCDYKLVFKNRIIELGNNSKKLIILQPVPTYPYGIAESYLYKKIPWGEDVTINYSNWKKYISKTDQFFDELTNNNIQYLNTNSLFCNDKLDLCFGSKNEELFYSDNNHLTIEGNRILISSLLSILNN